MTALAINSSFYPSLATTYVRRGAGEDAQHLADFVRRALYDLRYRENCQGAVLGLLDIFDRCSSANWDGYGAKPVGRLALRQASKFLEMLPISLPAPEVAPEPDGEVALEWFGSGNRVFSVSLNGSANVSYAGYFENGATAHGTEIFNDSVPLAILQGIARAINE